MISASIRGLNVAEAGKSNSLMGNIKSGGESFGKIMAESRASNVNSGMSQNIMKDGTAGKSDKSSASNTANASSDSNSEDTASKIVNSKTDTVKDTEDIGTDDEKLLKAADKVKSLLKDKFGLTDEELEQIMSDMGLGMLDLLESSNITDLVVNIAGVDSAVSIITDSELSESFKDIVEYLDKLLTNLDKNVELPDDMESFEVIGGQKEFIAEENTNTVGQLAQDTQSVKENDADSDNLSSIEQVIESKLTVNNESNGAANTEKRHDFAGNKNTEHSNIYDTAVGNLSQSIQDAFDMSMISEATQINPSDVIRQIVDAVKLTNTQSMQSIEIQLSPESLGKINLTVSAKNGVITAEIATQNEQVKRAVESQMTTLKENLESQGIKVDAVEVTVQSHAFESGQNLQGNNSQQEQAAKEAKKALRLDGFSDFSEDESAEADSSEKVIMNENSSVEYTA